MNSWAQIHRHLDFNRITVPVIFDRVISLPKWLIVLGILTLLFNVSCSSRKGGVYSDQEVRRIIRGVEVEHRHAGTIQRYRSHLASKGKRGYSDSRIKSMIQDIRDEYRYAHDPYCKGDRGCMIESYKWHLYYRGRPDFLN